MLGSKSSVAMGRAQLRAAPRVARHMAGRGAAAGRTATVKVLAYRDSDRAEQLVSIAKEFLRVYLRGIEQGTEEQLKALDGMVDNDVTVRTSQVLQKGELKGVAALKAKIVKDRGAPGLRIKRSVLHAANDTNDTVFLLLEGEYQGGPNDSAAVLNKTGWQILKLDIMLDEGCRKVMHITERHQLGPNDNAQLSASLTPFPVSDIKPHGQNFNVDKAKEAAFAWVSARSSSEGEAPLDQFVDPSFKLWDAYGVLPLLKDATISPADVTGASSIPYSDAKTVIKHMKEKYDVNAALLDTAISHTESAGFTHWKANLTNKSNGKRFQVEALQVDVYGDDSKLKEIWMFRDPLDTELEQLEKNRRAV